MRLALGCVLLLAACAVGCTSSDYEDLERRNQLLQLEVANMQHERDGIARELTEAKAARATLEQKASDLAQVEGDTRASARDLSQQLDDARQRVGFLEAQLQALRDFLGTDAAGNKKERERILETVTPVPATTH